MQCPNCGKEAINVGGRYVCLDCGIELAADGTQTNAQATPTLDNHNSGSAISADVPVPPADPAPAEPANSFGASPALQGAAPAESTPPVGLNPVENNLPLSNPQAPTSPVESSGPVMPAVPAAFGSSPTPEPQPTENFTSAPSPEPISSPDPSAVFEKPDEIQTPENPMPEPGAVSNEFASPVKDEYLNQLNQAAPSENFAVSPQGGAAGAVVPDFPDTTQNPQPSGSGLTENPSAATPPPQTPFATQAPELSMDSAFTNQESEPSQVQTTPSDTPAIPDGQTTPTNQPTEISPASDNLQPQPQPESPLGGDTPAVPVSSEMPNPNTEANYFQPASMDITGDQPGNPFNPTPETTEPEVSAVPDTSLPEEPVASSVPTEPETQPMPDNSVTEPLVDPLEQTEPENSTENGAATMESITAAAPEPTAFPGTSNLPSTESVFGTAPEENVPAQSSDVAPAKRKLWLWILIGVLVLLLLVGAGVFAYVTLFNGKQGGQTGQSSSGQLLTISQNVGGQMDGSTNVAATFDQTLDFGGATPKDSSQALFFSKPTELKETWAVNSNQDTSLDATLSLVNSKRIYIAADNATYVYSNDTKGWVKTDGSQLSPSSIFFPVDSRGSLFYLSRVDNFQSAGTESVGGKTAKKIKIIPKKETVEELLTSAAPLFSKINYTNVDVSGLTVYAWVDDQNRILKVEATGDVSVSSDIYNGSVAIKSTGTYSYDTQTVKKPV